MIYANVEAMLFIKKWPATNDSQFIERDERRKHFYDKHIASDLFDILQEAEIEIVLLVQMSQLEIAADNHTAFVARLVRFVLL